ncbi:MAG TPA: hypothetical protein VIC61_06820 [Gammaproteobacteria bacterium]
MNLKPLLSLLAALALTAYMPSVHASSTSDTEAELDKMADEHNAQAESEREEVVCKWEAKTGSRIKEKVCRSKTQIKYDADRARQFVNKPRGVPTKAN